MARYGLDAFLAEVEADIAWRQGETRLLKRALENSDNPTASALRRAFITLLYAHVEGGVKTALMAYVRVINEGRLSVGECTPPVVAAAWGDLFHALSDQSRKHDFFKARFPDNTRLHRFARQADFVARLRQLEDATIDINGELVIDTESNLDSIVLTKLLFRLGFPPEVVAKRFSDLAYLRGLRNAVAHGERTPVTIEQCNKYEKVVFELLPRLRNTLATAVKVESFRRKVA